MDIRALTQDLKAPHTREFTIALPSATLTMAVSESRGSTEAHDKWAIDFCRGAREWREAGDKARGKLARVLPRTAKAVRRPRWW